MNAALIEAHGEALKEFQISLEKQSFMVKEAYDGVGEVRGTKLDVEKYNRDLAGVRRELTGNRYSSEDVSNRMKETDNFLDKYLPIRVQTMISKTLHKILKYDEELKLCHFE